jgi:hypothetical protein
MRVLIIHHLEPCWSDGYRKFGTSFERLQEKFLDFLAENVFDKIILTRFEEFGADVSEGYSPEFLAQVTDFHSYAYGWDNECAEQDPSRFVDGGNHSEKVLVDDWMLPLKRAASVTISGAFDGECVEDLEIALRAIGIDFSREESLIV